LVLDTLSTNPTLVLDTIWHVRFDSLAVAGNSDVNHGVNVYNAVLTNFSKSGFTLNFSWFATYPDSIGGHEGGPPNFSPLKKPDTLRYVLNYVNF
jgi:hypothetical protein